MRQTLRNPLPPCLIACGLALALSMSGALAQTYSWEDEDGNVHYGDSIPPEYRDQKQRTLEDGVEIEVLDAAMTEEEREAMEYEERLQREAEKAAAMQAKRDQRLMRVYGSREDLEQARETRVGGLEAQIRQISRNLDQIEQEVIELEERIEDYEQRDEEVPERIAEQYEDRTQQMLRYERRLIEHEDELEKVEQRFQSEKERLVELLEEDGDAGQASRQ